MQFTHYTRWARSVNAQTGPTRLIPERWPDKTNNEIGPSGCLQTTKSKIPMHGSKILETRRVHVYTGDRTVYRVPLLTRCLIVIVKITPISDADESF